jgi:hypothetical protein
MKDDIDAAKNNDNAGIMLFKFKLLDWTETRHRLSSWSETFSTPKYILIRNQVAYQTTETSSWSALSPDFEDVKPPLVNLLNRYLKPLRNIVDIDVSKHGWAVFAHEAPDSLKTALFLAWTGDHPVIIPLYFGAGQGVQVELNRRRIVVSPLGDMFVAIGKSVKGGPFYPHDRESETKAAIFLGKVEVHDGKPLPKLVHISDIPDISVSPSPIAWFPGSNGFAVLSGDYDEPKTRFWIYSLDENPIDWSKVPVAVKVP